MSHHFQVDRGSSQQNAILRDSLWKAIGGPALTRCWRRLWHDPLLDCCRVLGLSNDQIGVLGEELATHFLSRQPHTKILYRNFRAPQGGEVDIVCRQDASLLFVEVKTRTSTAFGRPMDAVNREKQQLIAQGAVEWLRLLDAPGTPFRFDVVEVVLIEGQLPQITLIENAFSLPEKFYLPG